jgi:deazaflavin-dependent oxidoreductase (nitroreductase family)
MSRSPAERAAALLRVRWFVRTPIWLYRARLGFLFGSRLLMLEHLGRASGRKRYVVLEVVARPADRTFVVVSGFGERAQWYRNVVAHPRVRIFAGGRRPVSASARVMSQAESSAALAAYAAAHPRAWAALRPVFERTLGAEIGEHTDLPMVELRADGR